MKHPTSPPHDDPRRADYIQNDSECPRPRTGPRIVVAFWAVDESIDTSEAPPPIDEPPWFTITYPVGLGHQVYNWKHISPGDTEEPIHPNSLRNGEWVNGYYAFEQFTKLGGRQAAGAPNPSGNPKTSHWQLFQDFPQYLWGRIVEIHEIDDVYIRESAPLKLRGADGNYMCLGADAEVACDAVLVRQDCSFTAHFPSFSWSAHGGSGDEQGQPFWLKAANGKFLRLHTLPDGSMRLRADAAQDCDACLFEATQTPDGQVCLTTEASELVVQQGSDHSDYKKPSELAVVPSSNADETWAWFELSYGQVNTDGFGEPG